MDEREKALLKKRYAFEVLKYRIQTLEGFLDRNRLKCQSSKKIYFPMIGIVHENEKGKEIEVVRMKQKMTLNL